MYIIENLSNINPRLYTASAVIIGFLLIDDFSALEQNAIGNWLMLVGQLLESNSAQQQLIESNIYSGNININSKINKSIYDPLFYNLDKMKDILSSTNPNNSAHVLEMLKKMIFKLEKHINDLTKK